MVLKKLGDELVAEFLEVVRFLGEEQGMRVLVEPHEYANLVRERESVCVWGGGGLSASIFLLLSLFASFPPRLNALLLKPATGARTLCPETADESLGLLLAPAALA